MLAVEQQFPSAIHSAKVYVTSLFKSIAGKTSCHISCKLQLEEARRAAGAEMVPAALSGGIPAGAGAVRDNYVPRRRVIPVNRAAPSVAEGKWWSSCRWWRRISGERSCFPGRQPFWGLPWPVQGSALKHPTKASQKKWLKKISLQKECVCPSVAGVLHGS